MSLISTIKTQPLIPYKKAVHLSHETGFFTIGSFIFGAPFETAEHFNRTLLFAKSLPLDSVSFLPLRYMIGSELWNQAVSEGKINEKEYLVPADKNRGLGNLYQRRTFRVLHEGTTLFLWTTILFYQSS